MLHTLGIREMEKKQYAQLSTGQKRRLHLALALIGDPDIIFLDEPTAGLDVEGRHSLHEQIRKLKSQGKPLFWQATIWRNKVGKKYFIHIKTQTGDSTFETDNIEDTLISLLGELKQKEIHVLDIKVDRGTLEQHFMEMTRRDAE